MSESVYSVQEGGYNMENMMVLGSHLRRELSVSSSIVINEANHGDDYPYHKLPCAICSKEIGLNAEGREFVPCECAFRMCRPCYEYIRLHEGNRCPSCLSKYRRMKGSPAIPGDSADDVMDHFEEQLPPSTTSEYRLSPDEQALVHHQHQQSQVAFFDSHEQLDSEFGKSSAGAAERDAVSPRTKLLIQQQQQQQAGMVEDGGITEIPEGLIGKYAIGQSEGDIQMAHQGGTLDKKLEHVAAYPCSSTAGETDSNILAVQAMDATKSPPEYGYGSIVWHKRTSSFHLSEADGDRFDVTDDHDDVPLMVDDTRRPLWRKVPVAASLINPYRFVVILRLIATLAFFYFRVTNPNKSAYFLWLTSVICEIWFGISWIFDQIPKWSPITRETYLDRLRLRCEPDGQASQLPNVDIFVSTADPEKEPPLVTANVVLSILAADYPVEKMALYLSDDGASMLTFEALTETANFARSWVPFCKRYTLEPRAPEVYFSQTVDYLKGQVQPEFVRERRRMKREYDEFKVRINSLVAKSQEIVRDGWRMPDGTPWPGNVRSNHVGMIQVFLQPESGTRDVNNNPLPRLVYMSREKRPGFEHNKKAGAMNALMRSSALISNAPFVLNLDCDHYINNSAAIREGVCFLIDPRKGGRVCFVQFPQRFDGVDRNDRYANHNTVFYDVNMKGQDGQQGPMYVGTGCMFRRQALYGFDPPPVTKAHNRSCCCPTWLGGPKKSKSKEGGKKHRRQQTAPEPYPTAAAAAGDAASESAAASLDDTIMPGDAEEGLLAAREVTKVHIKHFGMCHNFILSTFNSRGGSMVSEDPREVLSDAILVISCGYEDNSDWGKSCGWVYGSVTEDIVTGYIMHTRGWRSVYCMPKRPAFKGSAPINLTDRLAQVLRWATGSVEIFFSGYNPLWSDCCTNLKFVQRLAYINTCIYPFTSIALLVYCFLPAICITLEEWWRNEQFWVIGGTSSHLAAVLQGLLKVAGGLDVHFTLTAKGSDDEDSMSELYTIRWTWLFLVPITIILVNCLAILTGVAHAINSSSTQGLMGRSQRTPTIVIVWALLIAVMLSLLWSKTGV
eukprot:jgi/Mesen1/10026/ME000073S09304